MSNATKVADPIADPLGYLVTSKSQPKSPGMDNRQKSDAFTGEKGSFEDEKAAIIRNRAALAEWDKTIKPVLKTIAPLLGPRNYITYLESPLDRLATVNQTKYEYMGRIGVSPDLGWFYNNERDEIFRVDNAKQAMAGFLDTLRPVFIQGAKDIAAQKVTSAERAKELATRVAANREIGQHIASADGFSPAFTPAQMAVHNLTCDFKKA